MGGWLIVVDVEPAVSCRPSGARWSASCSLLALSCRLEHLNTRKQARTYPLRLLWVVSDSESGQLEESAQVCERGKNVGFHVSVWSSRLSQTLEQGHLQRRKDSPVKRQGNKTQEDKMGDNSPRCGRHAEEGVRSRAADDCSLQLVSKVLVWTKAR